MKRATPREKLATLLCGLGFSVSPRDIVCVRGSVLEDTLSHWRVVCGINGEECEVVSLFTITRCVKEGIRLEQDPERFCLYGDVLAVPNGEPVYKSSKPWTP